MESRAGKGIGKLTFMSFSSCFPTKDKKIQNKYILLDSLACSMAHFL